MKGKLKGKRHRWNAPVLSLRLDILMPFHVEIPEGIQMLKRKKEKNIPCICHICHNKRNSFWGERHLLRKDDIFERKRICDKPNEFITWIGCQAAPAE